jgi:hypothetical protein
MADINRFAVLDQVIVMPPCKTPGLQALRGRFRAILKCLYLS